MARPVAVSADEIWCDETLPKPSGQGYPFQQVVAGHRSGLPSLWRLINKVAKSPFEKLDFGFDLNEFSVFLIEARLKPHEKGLKRRVTTCHISANTRFSIRLRDIGHARHFGGQTLQAGKVIGALRAQPVILSLNGLDLTFERRLALEQAIKEGTGRLYPGLGLERRNRLDQFLEFSHDGVGRVRL